MKFSIKKYIFGATSAIITNMALIAGLHNSANAKLSIIGSLFVIALADNLSDSMGIHIYQEAETSSTRDVWFATGTNFLARLAVSLGFITIVFLLPLDIAVYVSALYGLVVLAIFSYVIGKIRNVHPIYSAVEHVVIAIIVIFVSNYLGNFISGGFSSF
ncbi:MAG: hypothetical protein WCO21_02175 [bacterium]|nr:hypothetical protein [Candidatus Jorgensenbacteria bacterium]